MQMSIDDIKFEIKKFFSNLKFYEEEHSYFVESKSCNSGKEKISSIKIKKSVSTLCKNFKKKFPKNALKLKALSLGISEEELSAVWKEKSRKSTEDIGKPTHAFAEKLFNGIDAEPVDNYQKAVYDFYKSIPFYIVPVKTELSMYHLRKFFAGTLDLLLYNTVTKTFIICDFKTNKNLFNNFNGKTLIRLFKRLLDCDFNIYQVQLNFYKILFEQTGFKVSSLNIIWIKPDGTFENYECEIFPELEEYVKKMKKQQ